MPPGEPGGPDSEVFFDFGANLGFHERSPYKNEVCHPNCDCGRFMEIANSVFMQYQKKEDGTLVELSQKNVDFGGGLERLVAATNNDPDLFNSDQFSGARKVLEEVQLAGSVRNIRIILDHIRAAMFMIDGGVLPSNKEQGYILRRLIRRAAAHSKIANIDLASHLVLVLQKFVRAYESVYPLNRGAIYDVISSELFKFEKNLKSGMNLIGKASAFDLFQTYGFPSEIIEELFRERGIAFDKDDFEEKFNKHQELSRAAAKGIFKGGLADRSEQTTKLHTAHHLLLAALQKVVDPTIKQRGSNITAERLRIDINFSRKLTDDEIRKTESLVNEKIRENLPVTRKEMDRSEAEKIGAQMEFGQKYPDRVSVYFIGSKEEYFSVEFCGGPHVDRTGVLDQFAILKEESVGSGIRRIYGVLAPPTS